MEENDKLFEVIDKVISGNLQEFKYIVNNYKKLVFNIINTKLPKDLIYLKEDISQEIFIRVFENLSSYKKQYSFINWIYTITVNVIKDLIKKENKQKKTIWFYKKWQRLFWRVIWNWNIKKTINTLPEKYQKVLFFYYNQNKKIQEISEITGKPVNTIKTWLKRARVKLEKKLKNKIETKKNIWKYINMKTRKESTMDIEEKIKNFYNATRISEEEEKEFDSKIMDKIYDMQYNRKNKFKTQKLNIRKKCELVLPILILCFTFIFYFNRETSEKELEEYIEKEIVYLNNNKDIKVMIIGDFNNWSPTPMEYDGEKWAIRIKVKKNTIYTYNFLIEDDYTDGIPEEKQMTDYFGNSSIVFISH